MMRSNRQTPEDATPGEIFEPPEGLQVVVVCETSADANEAGLVILAMGNAYWTLLHAGRYYVCVRAPKASAVASELREYSALNRRPRRSEVLDYHEFRLGWVSFLLFAVVLIAGFTGQHYAPITDAGRADSVAMVTEGEWWRSVTALTLHADIVHLASNLVSGVGFALFVCRFFGTAAGWALILLSGAGGNALNALVYFPEPHYSIGASTAVFGALGLLTGIGAWAAVREPDQRLMLPRWLIPVFAGLTLLGLFGLGEGNVDVAAHISGFFCGTVLGFTGAFAQPLFIRMERVRFATGALVLAAVAAAWVFGPSGFGA